MADFTADTDITEVLTGQHGQIKWLLTKVAAGSGLAVDNRFGDLRRLLELHEAAEQEVVVPALRAAGDAGRRVADARTAEEAEAGQVLARLEEMKPGTARFWNLFESFRVAVLVHAAAEEAEAFPILRDHEEPLSLRRMARDLVMAEQTAPTSGRPKAGLAGSAPLELMHRVRQAHSS